MFSNAKTRVYSQWLQSAFCTVQINFHILILHVIKMFYCTILKPRFVLSWISAWDPIIQMKPIWQNFCIVLFFPKDLLLFSLIEVNLQVVLVLPRTLLIYSICIRLRTLGTQLHDEVSKQVKAFVETQVKTRKAVLIFFLF